MDIYRSAIDSIEQIIEARNRVQLSCEELGFDVTERLQAATSMFELGKWLLEQGGGMMIASFRTEGDDLLIEMEALVPKKLEAEKIRSLLDRTGSATSSLKGIPAVHRLMDRVDVDVLVSGETRIVASKSRTGTSKKLAKNLVGFLQEKFRSLSKPSVYEDLRAQNAIIAQSLTMVEEKAQELERKNAELHEVRQELEASNRDLHDKTAELQEALLNLGDRTAELTAQNRRFSSVLKHISEGILVSDSVGMVVEANDAFLALFGLERESILHKGSADLCRILGQYSSLDSAGWKSAWSRLSREPEMMWSTEFAVSGKAAICRSMPISREETGPSLGRIWFFAT